MKRGEIVVKILQGGGFRTASFAKIKAVKKGIAYLGEGRKEDDVNAYDSESGRSINNYIPGFSSSIVTLDDGEKAYLKKDEIY